MIDMLPIPAQFTAKVIFRDASWRRDPTARSPELGPKIPVGTIITGFEVVIVKPNIEEWLALDMGGYVHVVYPNLAGQPVRRLAMPPNSNLRRIKWDFEVTSDHLPRSISHDYEFWRKPATASVGFPGTVKTLSDHWVRMGDLYQHFWFDLLAMQVPGLDLKRRADLDYLKNEWRVLTRGNAGLTNGKGTDRNRDYIRGANWDQGDPGQETLATIGNVVGLLSFTPRLYRGKIWYMVQTIDGRKRPPSLLQVNRESTPELVHVATTSTPFMLPDGSYRVGRFPVLDEHNADPVYPFVSNGGFNWIEARWLEPIGDTIPRPTNP